MVIGLQDFPLISASCSWSNNFKLNARALSHTLTQPARAPRAHLEATCLQLTVGKVESFARGDMQRKWEREREFSICFRASSFGARLHLDESGRRRRAQVGLVACRPIVVRLVEQICANSSHHQSDARQKQRQVAGGESRKMAAPPPPPHALKHLSSSWRAFETQWRSLTRPPARPPDVPQFIVSVIGQSTRDCRLPRLALQLGAKERKKSPFISLSPSRASRRRRRRRDLLRFALEACKKNHKSLRQARAGRRC